MKICSKGHQIAPFNKNFLVGACPRTPLTSAWLRKMPQAASRHATRPDSEKLGPPLENPAYAHGTNN